MKKLILVTTLFILFASCKILRPPFPDSDLNSEVPQIDSLISTLNIPLNVNLTEIENSINLEYPIGKRIYSIGHTNENRNNRISHIRVDVRDKIKITTSGGFIKAFIPLVVDIRYEWWKNILGIKYSDYIRAKKLETNVYINIKPLFKENWGFDPIVESKVRLHKPKTVFLFLAGLQLFSQDGKISSDVKKAIVSSIDVRNAMKMQYKKLSKPLLLSDQPDSTWLSFKPIKFNFSPPKSVSDSTLKLNFAFNSNILVKTGVKPDDLDLSELPNIFDSPNYDNSLNLLLKYDISLKTIENLFNQNLVGTYRLTNKRKIKIKNIGLGGKNGKLYLKIDFRSRRTYGWIYLIGKLNINKKQTVEISDLKFSTATNNILVDRAVWLIDLLFVNKVEEQLKYPVKDELDNYKRTLNEDIKEVKVDSSLTIRGIVNELLVKGIYISKDELILIPNAQGEINLFYD